MEHIAIDLGGMESQICVRAADGTIVEEVRRSTQSLERYLKSRPPSRVIVETSAEAFSVADGAITCGHEVRVVPATLVRSLGVGARRTKTDRRDAQVLSEVSSRIDLPSVHIPSHLARELKTMCASREALVGTRTKLVNNVRGWLRTRRTRIRTGGTSSFPQRLRDKFRKMKEDVPAYIERELIELVHLNHQIKEAGKELAGLAAGDEVLRRLMSVPGVGPVTAVRFWAALDDHTRFAGAHSVQAYLGLTPGENSSSTRVRRTGLTKAGSKKVRWVLVQAAWCALRTRPHDPMVRWALRVAERRGRFIAAVALARKIAGILYAIWRDGTNYQPSRGAQIEQTTKL